MIEMMKVFGNLFAAPAIFIYLILLLLLDQSKILYYKYYMYIYMQTLVRKKLRHLTEDMTILIQSSLNQSKILKVIRSSSGLLLVEELSIKIKQNLP